MSGEPDVDAALDFEVIAPNVRERLRIISVFGTEVRRTSRDALKRAGIESGDHLTLAALEEMLAEHEGVAALERATLLLGHRDRSRGELFGRLAAEGYPQAVIVSALDRLAEWGYIDDGRFADLLVRTKVAAGWGRVRILRALHEASVADELALNALDQYAPGDDEATRAASLVPAGRPSTHRERERWVARLVRKGFDYDVARSVVPAVEARDTDR